MWYSEYRLETESSMRKREDWNQKKKKKKEEGWNEYIEDNIFFFTQQDFSFGAPNENQGGDIWCAEKIAAVVWENPDFPTKLRYNEDEIEEEGIVPLGLWSR